MKERKEMPTQAALRCLVEYSPETGDLTWKVRNPDDFPDTDLRSIKAFNTGYAGKPALSCRNGRGYMHGTIFGQYITAHRVIWRLVTGEVPETIDHINGDQTDNRWVNLRNVTNKINSRNKRLRTSNRSGCSGVWREDPSKWRAYIRAGGRNVALGVFDKKQDAIAARRAAERRHGYHTNHGRSA